MIKLFFETIIAFSLQLSSLKRESVNMVTFTLHVEVAGSISRMLCMVDSRAHTAPIGCFSGGHPTVGLLALIQKFVLHARTRKPAESMLQT